MKRRVTERVLVLILSIAVLLSSTGIYTVFATQENTAGSQSVTDSSTVADDKLTATDTQENIVEGGGAVEPHQLEGEGTIDNPYRIADADDLFLMQDVVNDSSKQDKNFILVADIDLSGVTAADLAENSVIPGTIVSVNKSLSDATPKSVWFNFNGCNHKIYGLNVTAADMNSVAIFGYISKNSTVKNITLENCNITVKNEKAISAAVLALVNDGFVRNSAVNNVTLNVQAADKKAVAGAIVAKNSGTISSLTAENVNVNVVCAIADAGAITGVNSANISSVKAAGVCVTTNEKNVTANAGAVAGTNNSKIKDCAVSVSCVSYAQQSGGISGFSAGEIVNCSVNGGYDGKSVASKSASTIVAAGVFGGIVGRNNGKIVSSTAADMSAFLLDGAVYGGVAGSISKNSVIDGCVATGAAAGKGVAGGIAGKAEDGAVVKNCYSFVALSSDSARGAVIGEGKATVENNMWSSEISGRYVAYESGSEAGDIIRDTRLITINAGKSKVVNLSALGGSFGAVNIVADSVAGITLTGNGVEIKKGENDVTLKAIAADKAATLTYKAKVTVNAGYNNVTVISRDFTVAIITLEEDAKGNGLSADSPIMIDNSAKLDFIRVAPFAYFELAGDVVIPESWKTIAFNGHLNGAGFAIEVVAPVFSGVFGSIRNVTVKLNGEIRNAMFGDANSAEFNNVRLIKGQVEEGSDELIRLVAEKACVAPFLNKVMGNTVINASYAEIPVHITSEKVKNVAGFIALVDAAATKITSSGASVTITSDSEEKSEESAAFIGKVENNAEGTINGCFATLDSEVVDYAFIGSGNKENFKAEGNLVSFGNDKVCPEELENVAAAQWMFDAGAQGFISGKGSVVSISVPAGIEQFNSIKPEDFIAVYNSEKLSVNTSGITVKDGIIYLPVEAAEGVVTVLNSEVTLIHKPTGLKSTIGVSNGLEKDKDGNYLIYYAVDIAFIGENLEKFGGESFKLANDIDMSKLTDFKPVGGTAAAFSGKFDGCSHTIYGLNVNGTSKAALFGTLKNAVVTNFVIDSAVVSASGSYAGVVAGQLSDDTMISKVTIKNSKVSVAENYAGVIAGSVNGNDVVVKDVTVQGAEISAMNYAGAVAGNVEGSLEVSKVTVTDIKASASGYAGAVAGSASVLNANAVKISRAVITADSFAGGFAGAFAGEIDSAELTGSTVTGAVAGGLVGSTISGNKAAIRNSTVDSTTVNLVEGATAAGGLVASVADGSSAEIADSKVNGNVKIGASMASGGFIGDVHGEAKVTDSVSYAYVMGYEFSTKAEVGAGGVIGKVNCDDFASVFVKNVNVGGKVSGYDYVGGIIGNVLSEKASAVAISGCVAGAEVLCTESENSALVIGSINKEIVSSAVEKVVISTYGTVLGAYSSDIGEGTYTDLDKHIESSLDSVVKTNKEFAVEVKNTKADELGFVFDDEAGWQSESDERVTVISSSENNVSLVANKSSQCAVVATYRLATDKNITLKVHFDVEADIVLALEGAGTKADPYRISDGFELDAVRDYMGEGVYFTLVNDITFNSGDFAFGGNFYNKGAGFAPLGTDEAPFEGVFDGNGYSIKEICINGDEASLFGTVKNAEIRNIKLNINANGVTLAAGVAAKAYDSVISNAEISGSVTVSAENSSVAGVVAYADSSELSNIIVKNITVSTPSVISSSSVVYAAGVVARAIGTTVSDVEVNAGASVKSAGYAGGVIGYAENVTVKSAVVDGSLYGEFAGAVFANVVSDSVVSKVTIGGEIEAPTVAGIAAVANGAIKAENVVIATKLEGETAGIAVAVADDEIYLDENSAVGFSNIVYSGYQCDADAFGEAELNSYQLLEYAEAFIDVNAIESADGEFVAVGKDAVSIRKAIRFMFDAKGDAHTFNVGETTFVIESVSSQPEGLVSFDGESVTAKATAVEDAKLILRYSNGIETSVDMISVMGMSGNGTEVRPYIISNEDTMLLLNIYPSAYYILSDDVTLIKEWTPVPSFTGKINGNGHTLSGLVVKAENAGLFETIAGSAEITDLTVASANIEGTSNAGVIAAAVSGDAKLVDVSVTDSTVKAVENAAAIAGAVNSGAVEINSCLVSGCNIEAKNAAGVAGVADTEGLVIEECSVLADVTGENAASVVAVADSDITVTDCIVSGAVKGESAESGIIAVVTNQLNGEMLVAGNEVSTELSGEAANSASVVGVFEVLPEDNESFAGMFNSNTVNNGVDSFQREVMQYQNFDGNEIVPEVEIALKGNGTAESPYEIYNIADFEAVPDGSSDHFVLMNDIVITAEDYGTGVDADGNTVYGVLSGGYSPIKDFSGSFDGNGFVIRNLYIDSESDYVGLFANINAAGQVKNVHLEILDESQGYGFSGINGAAFVGGIAGYCESIEGLVNCTVEGGTVSGERAVGALVGELASSKLENCASMVIVVADKSAGGLAGITKGSCSVEGCVTASVVDGNGGTIVGVNEGRLTVSDVLSTGASKNGNSITIGKNSGEASIEKAVIGGTNAGGVISAADAETGSYVYSDVTTLGTEDENIRSVSTGNLIASLPEGLDGWIALDGSYPVPALADAYAVSLVKLACVPVFADIKEGKEVVEGFKYPVTVGSKDVTITSSTISGENDLYIEANRIYNDLFTGEMPYVVIADDNFSRVVLLPQRNDENTLYISLEKHIKALAQPDGRYAAFSKYLNNEKAEIVLVADVDLGASALNDNNAITPINGFKGSFNGNGFTISNMRISAVDGSAGLFSTIGGSSNNVAEFKDITFDNVYITGSAEAGALAGCANEFTSIENIRVENSSGSAYISGSVAGAVVGLMSGGTINCAYADASVEGGNIAGGLVGLSDATITRANAFGKVSGRISDTDLAGVGGLVGVMNSGLIYTSASSADVTVDAIENAADENSVAGVGGLVGVAKGKAVEESFSSGAVKVTDAQVADGKSVVGIGGLAGVAYCDIESVYSSSSVTADFTGNADGDAIRALGGLVGVAYGDIADAYASGGVSATEAGVRLYGSDCFTGGVVGYAFGESYENLYFDKYMNNDENLTAVSNIMNESCYRLSTEDLIAGAELSSAFGFAENAYPYLKAMLSDADSQLNSVLSVVVTTADGNDESVKNGAGASKPVTLPAEITLGSKTYALKWSAGENAVIDGQSAQLNRVKMYAEYLSLFVSVDGVSKSYNRLYNDIGTAEEALGNTSVELTLKNDSGDRYMDTALVGILIKSRQSDNGVVTSDVFATGDKAVAKLNKLLVTTGGFFVDASLDAGYDIVVTAKDSAGNAIQVTDAGAQGVFVETENSNNVVLEITIVEKDIPWGLTSLWENLVR